MATRMLTLLYGDTLPVPSSSEPPAPPVDRTSSAPPMPRASREWNALPSMVVGLVEAAAVWVGLALFMIALVYPLASATAFVLMMIGGWFAAAGVVAALSNGKRETA